MKEIIPVFEAIGKRRKLIGFDAKYNGESISAVLFTTEAEATQALNQYVFEELRAA